MSAAKNDKARAQLETHGRRVVDLVCDVGDEDQVEAAMATTIDRLGKVDSCFANAGIGGNSKSFLDLSAEYDRQNHTIRTGQDDYFGTFQPGHGYYNPIEGDPASTRSRPSTARRQTASQ